MGMEMMGNLNQQAKMAKMQQAWDMKKSGTLPIMGKTGASVFKTLAPEKKKTSDAEVKKRISKIKTKLKSGAKLGAADKAFLRKHAPELNRKVLALEKEREAYEERLKECKTRDEVEEAKLQKKGEMSSTMKDTDPEFAMIRMAQMTAAESEAAPSVKQKPWRYEIEQEEQQEKSEAVERLTEKELENRRQEKSREEGQWAGREEEAFSDERFKDMHIAAIRMMPSSELSDAAADYTKGQAAYQASAGMEGAELPEAETKKEKRG